jgi:hypothetical protein
MGYIMGLVAPCSFVINSYNKFQGESRSGVPDRLFNSRG